jgi:SAM-dependent methyltransferase
MKDKMWRKRFLRTPARYYVDKSYATWSHNARGRALEIGGGRIERYTKDSLTLDIDGKFNPDILASGYNLPFKDNAFDTVVATEVLEHLEVPKSFVCEVYRILRPGGTFFLTTRFIHEVHGEDYFRYTRLSLETLFSRFGIVNVEEQGSTLSALCQLTASSFGSPLLYSVLSLAYPLIGKIDTHGPKKITLGYCIYGEK